MTLKQFTEKLENIGLSDIVQAAKKNSKGNSERLPLELLSRLLDVMPPARLVAVLHQGFSKVEMANGFTVLFGEIKSLEYDIQRAMACTLPAED